MHSANSALSSTVIVLLISLLIENLLPALRSCARFYLPGMSESAVGLEVVRSSAVS
jgi:hypothetical protein